MLFEIRSLAKMTEVNYTINISTGNSCHNFHERSFVRQAARSWRPFSRQAARRKQRLVQLAKAVAEAVELTASDSWVEKTLRSLDRQKTPPRQAYAAPWRTKANGSCLDKTQSKPKPFAAICVVKSSLQYWPLLINNRAVEQLDNILDKTMHWQWSAV